MRLWTRARLLSLIGLGVAVVALVPAAADAKKNRPKRDVLVVSNNWEGTANLVNPHNFKVRKTINVIPDAAERIAEIQADPVATFYFDFIRENVGEGHNQYVDDGFTSTDDPSQDDTKGNRMFEVVDA